ncbi:deoxyribonuclease V [soil metagenome]
MNEVNLPSLHDSALTPTEAVALQRHLAPEVTETPLPEIRTVAGIDVSVRDNAVRAAIVVLSLEGLDLIESSVWEGPVAFPYVPGLLSFRELPAIWPALQGLRALPDLFVLDAQGRAPPRRFGLACHLRVLLDRPAIGVAKTRLVGQAAQPGLERGSCTDLVHQEELIGQVVRTRANVRPVYVSVGHRCTLGEAVALAMRTATRFRLPMPTHLAHRLSKYGRI